MFKKEKGITLIALVVTIIILLILAGVTLSLALQDNGLFQKTRDAANRFSDAQINETEIVNTLENVIDQYSTLE